MLRLLLRQAATSVVRNKGTRSTLLLRSVTTKKDTSHPMEESYSPSRVEKGWYDWWQSKEYFQPRSDKTGKPSANNYFSMVVPPPNVTGSLHIGHALTVSMEDALVRWHKMRDVQQDVTWIPGLDHAGIATQVVVEKQLKKTKNVSRHDLGRERFIEEVWRWKEQYGGRIVDQLKRTGAALDWSREVFTLSADLSRAVTEAFVRMHDEGLIYRDTMLVNWCCALQTVISDIEVDYEDLPGRTMIEIPGRQKKVEFGVLYKLRYPIRRRDEHSAVQYLEVCTTRPETILGDTALAIHPDDARYSAVHQGWEAVNPLTGATMTIVCDSAVDREFGTGVVKITPAHDHVDYQMSQRHNLRVISVLNTTGHVIGTGTPYDGLDRYEARARIVKELQSRDLLVSTSSHAMRLARCSRSRDVLEPLLQPQWYVRTAPLARIATHLSRTNQLRFVPEEFADDWYRWLDNIRDWCISRQLWWGHRVPAWQIVDSTYQGPARWVVARDIEEARDRAVKQYNVSRDCVLEQDPDVLDTWFSSGLYPLSVNGWPNKETLPFYPLRVMETGHDILFFWVARMVMLCSYLGPKKNSRVNVSLDDLDAYQSPFDTVWLHAVVRDAQGRKMSKSLGNVIDPLHVIEGRALDLVLGDLNQGNLDPREVKRATELFKKDFPQGIPECGTDALRFGLAAYSKQARNINMDINRLVAYRHFCNKIWNATRYIMTHVNQGAEPIDAHHLVTLARADLDRLFLDTPHKFPIQSGNLTLSLIDLWVLSKLGAMVREVNQGFDSLDLSRVTAAIHSFFMYDLCDVYLEFSKLVLNTQASDKSATDLSSDMSKRGARHVLVTCLNVVLRVMHPLMPFITEELWQRLTNDTDSIVTRVYPRVDDPAISQWTHMPKIEQAVSHLVEIVSAARSLRKSYSLKSDQLTRLIVRTDDTALVSVVQQYSHALQKFCKLSHVIIEEPTATRDESEASSTRLISERCHVIMPADEGLVDLAQEIAKLDKTHRQLLQRRDTLERQMTDVNYSVKVSAEVRAKNSAKLATLSADIAQVELSLRQLKSKLK